MTKTVQFFYNNYFTYFFKISNKFVLFIIIIIQKSYLTLGSVFPSTSRQIFYFSSAWRSREPYGRNSTSCSGIGRDSAGRTAASSATSGWRRSSKCRGSGWPGSLGWRAWMWRCRSWSVARRMMMIESPVDLLIWVFC